MKARTAPILVLLLLGLAFGPGCTAPPGGGGTPTPTPVQTTVPVTTPVPPTPVATIPPGPVVTVPPIYDITIQVMKNPSTFSPDITVTFRGGKGQYILSALTVTVARSDGQVFREVIPETGQGQYSVGDSVRIRGTTGRDEVVVVATILGVDYKIYDEILGSGSP
ncbi:MAG TPA: hypothetical protein VMS81_07195 [Methanomicrobiales archaeon]|jgi:hypothetical protein|nr:hypothetical protein [Methanomicrobiales archaeon]